MSRHTSLLTWFEFGMIEVEGSFMVYTFGLTILAILYRATDWL